MVTAETVYPHDSYLMGQVIFFNENEETDLEDYFDLRLQRLEAHYQERLERESRKWPDVIEDF